jgi:outer membrane protein OmpA-like peptidoglycan-associated protein
MKLIKSLVLILSFAPIYLDAQSATGATMPNLIEGMVKNEKNGNLIPDALVTVFDDRLQTPLAQTRTDVTGHYKIAVPKRDRYRVETKKSTYFKAEKIFVPETATMQQDLAINPKAGYNFDITTFDKAFKHDAINTLGDCKVEIYNNTTKEQELTIPNNPKSVFNFPFNEGNHYTVLVRKHGYINRRIEAFVNINGCILCVDGMGVNEPDVVSLMSHNNEAGYFLGNIDLDSIKVGKKFVIPNIYYDFDKWAIRSDASPVLDKLASFLKDNPSVKVELGAHTDARGSDTYNLTLSDKRAESAVNYLVEKCGVNKDNITWKGYGERELVNNCGACSESEHQKNRRTELKITGFTEEDPLWKHSLKEIIEDKDLYSKIIKLEKAGQPMTGNFKK